MNEKTLKQSEGIDPQQEALYVRRCNNGWTVDSGRSFIRGEVPAEQQFVVRTPGELAELIGQWAGRQVMDAKA